MVNAYRRGGEDAASYHFLVELRQRGAVLLRIHGRVALRLCPQSPPAVFGLNGAHFFYLATAKPHRRFLDGFDVAFGPQDRPLPGTKQTTAEILADLTGGPG